MCCCFDYDEAADVWVTKTVKARKPWKCEECGGEIAPGDEYQRMKSLYDGDWSTYRNCASCHAAKERAGKFGVPYLAYSFDELNECIPNGMPCRETERDYAEFGASAGLLMVLKENRRAAYEERKRRAAA